MYNYIPQPKRFFAGLDNVGMPAFEGGALGTRLERHEVETNHVAGKVNLANAVSVNLFFHLCSPSKISGLNVRSRPP